MNQKLTSFKIQAFQIRQTAGNEVKYLIVLLLLNLFSCIWTLRDSFWCSGGTESDCRDIRKKLSCKANIVSPMWSTFTVQVGSSDEPAIKLGVFCSWETASSQIRICLLLSVLYTVALAYRSILNESQSLADRVSIKFIFLISKFLLLVPKLKSTSGLLTCFNRLLRFLEYI